MRPLLALALTDSTFQKIRFRVAVITYLLILVLGSIPGAREEIGALSSGVVLHAVAYGFIAFCLFGGVNGGPRRKAATSWLMVAAMGAFDEYLQSFFPYRTAQISDWAIDAGAALCICVFLRIFLPTTDSSTTPQR